jgi:predicted lysophospholipase L1 biosynthesis ABC-type transport system permease subunit
MASITKSGVLESGVQRQITLSWRQASVISMRNVTLRIGRAAVTGAGIVLGIAFLVSVWTARVVDDGITQYETTRAKSVAAEQAIDQAQAKEAAAARQAKGNWLVVMSLLVCGVGITNSLLMSVTERFREIGTMKCLGALDEFIVRLFLIEAAVLGVLGSVAGAILGNVIVVIISMITKRPDVVAMMNWGRMFAYMGLAVAIGTFLSLVAAVFPAMQAAKMPPAAALRSEV